MRRLFPIACTFFVCSLIVYLIALAPTWANEPLELRSVRANLIGSERKLELHTKHVAAQKDPVTWSTFNSDQTRYAGRHVNLYQGDFNSGTLVIRAAGYFVLRENVTFAPNADIGFRVRRPEQNHIYPVHSAFALGFFAAIAIATKDGVVVDGAGHWIEQDRMMATQIRFYGHIHFSSAQFIGGQGPAPIDAEQFVATENALVANFNFGLTSHFAFALDLNRNIYVRNCTARDYEVSVFKVNGAQDVYLHDLTASGHRTDVPINSEFTTATFLLLMIESVPSPTDALAAAYRRLKPLVDEALADIREHGTVDINAHPEAYHLLASKSGLLTGSTTFQGIVTDAGVSVGPTKTSFDREKASRRVLLENAHFTNAHSHTVEALGITDADRTYVTGVVGAIFDLIRVRREYGSLAADPIVAAELEYARWLHANPGPHEFLSGRSHVPHELINWVDKTGGPLDASFGAFLQDLGWSVGGNADLQTHVIKKSAILKVQSSEQVYIRNVHMGGAVSTGDPPFAGGAEWLGFDVDPETYTADTHGHPSQAPSIGYDGCDVVGLLVAGSLNVVTHNVSCGTLISSCGSTQNFQEIPIS